MLDEIYNEAMRKRKAARQGKILVWYILLPLAVLFPAFRTWQILTGRI
jgi:hypothetical protein